MTIIAEGLEKRASESPRDEEMSDCDLADCFRTQSFHLMQAHPVAAAHLVLAAASLAPTCDAEQDVADQFSYVIADFAQQLGILHQHEIRKRVQEQRSASSGN